MPSCVEAAGQLDSIMIVEKGCGFSYGFAVHCDGFAGFNLHPRRACKDTVNSGWRKAQKDLRAEVADYHLMNISRLHLPPGRPVPGRSAEC